METDKLYMGNPFQTYLYFENPTLPAFSYIETARLILFKIPLQRCNCSIVEQRSLYHVFPLRDFFSVYYNCYEPPRAEDSFRIDYNNEPSMSYCEIDISNIVQSWMDGRIENRGLLLTSSLCAQYLAYASHQYDVVGMRPTIRVTYEGITVPLSRAAGTVEIR